MKNLLLSFAVFFGLTIFTFAQENKPLCITAKPLPAIPDAVRSVSIQGTVRLKIEFLSSGSIGKVAVVSSLPYGLTESAFDAGKKIKFEPEVKENQPVTVNKVVEYSFNWDGGWRTDSQKDEKAEAVIKRAVETMGGERYLQVKSQISSGNFTLFRGGVADIPTSFVDVIVFPDKERTEFRQAGGRIVQANAGETGWLFDGGARNLREQTREEIQNFRRGIRSSVDNLLRGGWRAAGATLSYAGQRQAGIGRRNDVIKLAYPDGFTVEFEFSPADGLPVKALYAGRTSGGEETKEEDRYAQFVEVQGIRVPFIVDHFQNGAQTNRINYLNVEINRAVPDAIFNKPNDARELRKDLKL